MEFNRPRARRQVADAVELQIEIIEFLAEVFEAFEQRDVNNRDAVARDGFDFFDARVLGELLFELARDLLFDLFGARAGQTQMATATLT